jgi:peptidoglycan/LPS O-acetylase OafA/YrhL
MAQVHPHWLLAIKTNPLARLSEFTLGICLGLLYNRGLRLGKPFVAIGFLGIAGLGCVSDQIPTVLLYSGILDPLFALLVMGLATNPGSFLSSPCMILLGEASYGLYILHHPLRRWFVILNHHTLRAAEDTMLFFLIYLGFIVLVSLIAVPLVEGPMKRIILSRKPQMDSRVAA